MTTGGVGRIGPGHIGCRVVVRYRLSTGGQATDVLGELARWDDGVLTVRRADGETVEVAAADVIAARQVAPRRLVRREIRALEAAAALGWQALESERLGGWLLRAAGGFTRRANSCLPLADPGVPLTVAVARVSHWYRERRLPPAFQVPAPLGRTLDTHLDGLGWPPAAEDVLVMTSPAAPVAAAVRGDLPSVTVSHVPDPAWLDGYHYRGGELPAHAREVLTNADTVGFASIDVDRRRVAFARGAVSDASDGRRWLGVTAVEVVPDTRRRGLGQQVMAGVAAWGRGHGATDVYLQVSEHNAAALAAYAQLGFTEHHRYHYRRRAEG
ncbi:MAG: GNAT family N-acetyltransferase [Jiangellaceae bacterium]